MLKEEIGKLLDSKKSWSEKIQKRKDYVQIWHSTRLRN